MYSVNQSFKFDIVLALNSRDRYASIRWLGGKPRCPPVLPIGVCLLIIMFDSDGPGQQAAAFDKPYYHISLRLLRVVSVLVEKYYRYYNVLLRGASSIF